MLSIIAENVVAIDISEEATQYAKRTHSAKNLTYLNLVEFEYNNNQKFDIIMSFQVIEHNTNAKKYIKSLQNKLRTGGLIMFYLCMA